MATPMRPPSDMSFGRSIVKSGMIWDAIERAGISGVQGVWCHEAGAMRLFNVISVKQAYAGHAKQVGLVAAGCQAGAYLGRFVVVVDDDVDPTDLFDVVWAISTRCDPALDIEVINRMWSGPLDPIIPHGSPVNYSSRGLIDACRPFERLKDFPPVVGATPELRARVAAKFAEFSTRFKWNSIWLCSLCRLQPVVVSLQDPKTPQAEACATGRDTMTTATTVNVPDLIDEQKVGSFQIRILVLCALAAMLDGFAAQMIGYLAPSVARDMHLGPAALTRIFAWGLLGLMLGALTFGPVADRFGRKPVIVACTLFYGVITPGHGEGGFRRQPRDPAIPRGPGFRRSDAQCHRADRGICPASGGAAP